MIKMRKTNLILTLFLAIILLSTMAFPFTVEASPVAPPETGIYILFIGLAVIVVIGLAIFAVWIDRLISKRRRAPPPPVPPAEAPPPTPLAETPLTKCPFCGTETPADAKFCPSCGKLMSVISLPIIKIEGIGPVYAEKLVALGIETSRDLLDAGRTPKGREELAEKTGLSPKLILEWVNLADLIRIKGVSEEYSDLLEEAGVDTVVELSRRTPENLYKKILEVNEEKKLVRRRPTLEMVTNWIEQAKKLSRVVEY